MSGSLTTDRNVRSHLTPMNLQIWSDDSDPTALGNWRFLVGLSDLDGAVVYNLKTEKLGDMQPINDNGELVYPGIMADPRGGLLTLVATLLADNPLGGLPSRRHSCRYGRVSNGHAVFQCSIIKSQQTSTSTAPTDKTTLGGKAGVSFGLGSGEASGALEHQGAGGSTTSTFAGGLRDFSVVWTAK